MLNQLLPAATFPDETHRCREYGFPALSRLHRARGERSPLPDVLDVVQDGDVGITGQNEVAVHAVDSEVGGDGGLGGGKALCDCSAAVDTAGTGWMPEGPGVGVNVLCSECCLVRACVTGGVKGGTWKLGLEQR